METDKLSNILKDQKLPLDEAVAQKIENLQSDDAFNPENDEYILFLRENAEPIDADDELLNAFSSDDELLDSFENDDNEDDDTSAPSPTLRFSNNQGEAHSQPMSMAQRIAALRGALNIPPEFKKK